MKVKAIRRFDNGDWLCENIEKNPALQKHISIDFFVGAQAEFEEDMDLTNKIIEIDVWQIHLILAQKCRIIKED